jgi:hypothetical protein
VSQKVRREAVRRPAAAVGSALFFLLAPGVVVGLIPWFNILHKLQAADRTEAIIRAREAGLG